MTPDVRNMKESDATLLCRWERRFGAFHLGWTFDDVASAGITQPVDGEPDLWLAVPRETMLRLMDAARRNA